jgi:hypothetical protein
MLCSRTPADDTASSKWLFRDKAIDSRDDEKTRIEFTVVIMKTHVIQFESIANLIPIKQSHEERPQNHGVLLGLVLAGLEEPELEQIPTSLEIETGRRY